VTSSPRSRPSSAPAPDPRQPRRDREAGIGAGTHLVLDEHILERPTPEAARALIGARLVRLAADGTRRAGRIVEVEAYVGTGDLASHARFGRTARNGVMFGRPGIAYVYLVYGMYECLNVVTEPDGSPAAVLIRAVEPVEGEAEIRAARIARAAPRHVETDRNSAAVDAARRRIERLPSARLCSGPGLVTAGFDIRRADTGTDLLDPRSGLRLEPAVDRAPIEIVASPRIGIDYAPEPWKSLPWRFIDAASPAVSGPKARGAKDRPNRVHGGSRTASRSSV
jgi:DNA-3-methyladenine glycosylase